MVEVDPGAQDQEFCKISGLIKTNKKVSTMAQPVKKKQLLFPPPDRHTVQSAP